MRLFYFDIPSQVVLYPIFKRDRPAQKIDMEALKKDVEENPDSLIYERAERFSLFYNHL
jgi:hypothetical protein